MAQRIGIVGGGQLGRMLCFAAKKLGFEVTVIDPTPNSPAGQVADAQILADYSDAAAIKKLSQQCDYITFEIELADNKVLAKISQQGKPVNPAVETLGLIKDKLAQKEFLHQHGIPVALFRPVETEADVLIAGRDFGYPLMLKARFDAYDGRGNAVIKTKKNISAAFKKLAGRKLYVEQWVPFKKELAIMIARNITGAVAAYPLTQTIHKNNICHLVLAPAPVDEAVTKQAVRLAKKTAKHLQGAGMFGIEMFLSKNNQVLINELAPRVHNSGHYTTEACLTSQFEQHIRAVTGLPLGSTQMVTPAAVMINILGQRHGPAQTRGLEKALALANVSVHIYGKAETKLERKMGHITVTANSINQALVTAKRARKYLTIWTPSPIKNLLKLRLAPSQFQ